MSHGLRVPLGRSPRVTGLRIGGLPSGSGFAFGLGYLIGRHSEIARADMSGTCSTKSFKRASAEIDLPGPERASPFKINGKGEYRDYPDLRFYGLGPDSDVDGRAHYLMEGRQLGVTVDYNLPLRIRTGVRASLLNASTGSGDNDRSLEERCEPSSVPAFDARGEWGVYGGYVESDTRDRNAAFARPDLYEHLELETEDYLQRESLQ